MSKWDKLITRICNLSKDIRFDELRKVWESYVLFGKLNAAFSVRLKRVFRST